MRRVRVATFNLYAWIMGGAPNMCSEAVKLRCPYVHTYTLGVN